MGTMNRSEIAVLVLAVLFGAWWWWDRREQQHGARRIKQSRDARRKDEN